VARPQNRCGVGSAGIGEQELREDTTQSLDDHGVAPAALAGQQLVGAVAVDRHERVRGLVEAAAGPERSLLLQYLQDRPEGDPPADSRDVEAPSPRRAGGPDRTLLVKQHTAWPRESDRRALPGSRTLSSEGCRE
jgi:hypothetical protein